MKTHKQIMQELKDTDIESYNEIKENTEEYKKKRGGLRQNAGRKRLKELSLTFTIRVDAEEKEFIAYARKHNINFKELMQG